MTRQTRLTHIAAPEGVAPGVGYTQVVTGTGRLVAVSGQIALDEDGEVVGKGDPEAQARQVFGNLQRCLAAAGSTFGDVMKLTYYVTDVAYMPAIRAARAEFAADRPLPAGTAVQVVALVRPDLLLEVDALALVADAGPDDPGELHGLHKVRNQAPSLGEGQEGSR
jgi:enamine deaminase RidA (YjgF/YER057c/UK114 family)